MSSGDWAASFCWLQQENPPRKGDSNISQLVDLYRPQLALRSSLAIVNRNSLENCLTCASSYIAGLTECVDLFSFSLSLSQDTLARLGRRVSPRTVATPLDLHLS
jgi:hypothetical protein